MFSYGTGPCSAGTLRVGVPIAAYRRNDQSVAAYDQIAAIDHDLTTMQTADSTGTRTLL